MKIAIGFVLALSLCSCATPQYGSFVKSSDVIETATIADDSVNQLIDIFPPAKSRFAIAQPTTDSFGIALVSALRQKGYAIREYVKPSPFKANKQNNTNYLPDETGLRFNYILDKFKSSDTYRISINVGDVTLTRAYLGVTLSEGFGRKSEGAKVPRAMGDWAVSGSGV